MSRNSVLLSLLTIVFFGCSEPPTGIAHAGIKEAYPFSSFGTSVYSESMIRAGLGIAKADSNHQLSSNTQYVLTFEMDKTTRWRNANEDSIVRYHISNSDAELLAEFTQKKSAMALYALIDNQTVNDLIIIDDSEQAYKVYEFVGEMPLATLLKTGINNMDEIQNLILPSTNAGTDSTDI